MQRAPKAPLDVRLKVSDMCEPDYTSYSLAELMDVYRHIDAELYPKRFARLKEELRAREARVPPAEYGSEMSETLGVPLKELGWFKKVVVSVQATSLALGINNIAGTLVGVTIPQLGLSLTMSLPTNSERMVGLLALFAFWMILLLLVVGGLSLFTKSRSMHLALPIAWAFLSFKVMVGGFAWWPGLHGGLDFSFAFETATDDEVTSAFQIILLPLFLAAASLITLPDRADGASSGSEIVRQA